jgi:hypothetical protein
MLRKRILASLKTKVNLRRLVNLKQGKLKNWNSRE